MAYTLRKQKKGTSHQTNKGPWMAKYRYAQQALYNYVLYEYYDGDVQRLSARQGLFSKHIAEPTLAWFQQKFPEVVVYYRETFGRELNAANLMGRVRFTHVKYERDRKIDGPRSNEYVDVIPAQRIRARNRKDSVM